MRTSFNAGILGKGMQLRSDMDAYARGLTVCENFTLNPLGGATRRNGFKYFGAALDSCSRIFPYVYSHDITLLIEIGDGVARVISKTGEVIVSISGTPWGAAELPSLRITQLKKAVIITHPNKEPHELSPADSTLKSWSLLPYYFLTKPARSSSLNDNSIDVQLLGERSVGITVPTSDLIHLSLQNQLIVTQEIDMSEYDIAKTEGYYPTEDGVPCGGQWQLYVGGSRSSTLTVQRCYKGGEWHNLGVSVSADSAQANQPLSGDETGNECYLRVHETVSSSSGWSDWNQKLIIEGWSRELRLTIDTIDTESGFSLTIPYSYPVDNTVWPFMRDSAVVNLTINDTVYEDLPVSVDTLGFLTIQCDSPNVPTMTDKVKVEMWYAYGSGDWDTDAILLPAGTSIAAVLGYYVLSNGEWKLTGTSTSTYTYGTDQWIKKYRTSFSIPSMPSGGRTLVLYEGYPTSISSIDDDCYALCILENEIEEGSEDGSFSTKDWSWVAWSNYYGYPRHALLHQERIVFASSTDQPQTLWFSHSDDLSRFDIVTDMDSGGIAATLASSTESTICWMLGKGQDLLVGTTFGEYVISAGGGEGVLTASNILAYPDAYVGAATDTPVVTSSEMVVYVERGAHRVRKMGYSEEGGGYISADLNLLCPEVITDGGGCVDLCTSQKPTTLIYALRADGKIACCTFNPMQTVNAWSLWTVGDMVITSMAILPNMDENDSIYLKGYTTSSDENGAEVRTYHILMNRLDDESERYTDFHSIIGDDLYGKTVEATLITTDMVPSSKASLNGDMHLFLENAIPAKDCYISADGGNTWAEAASYSGTLDAGWAHLTAPTSNKTARQYGVKFASTASNADFTVLALDINPT